MNIFCEIGRLNMAARYYKVCVSLEHELNITLLQNIESIVLLIGRFVVFDLLTGNS